MTRNSTPVDKIELFRSKTFRLLPELRIGTESEALQFIRSAGFLLLWASGEQLNLPSLSAAYTDKATGWGWWEWKQTLPEKKACYYAKVLRHKGTFLSWKYFPYFYAVYASRRPYEEEWQEGVLDRTHKRLLDILSTQGPLMTKELRLAYGPPSKANTRLVKQALENLQRTFRVCPSGGDTEGWSHHRWELVDRWVPRRYIEKGEKLDPEQAGAAIIARYLRTVGASNIAEISWLFGWEKATTNRFLQNTPNLHEIEIEGVKGSFFTLKPLVKELQRG